MIKALRHFGLVFYWTSTGYFDLYNSEYTHRFWSYRIGNIKFIEHFKGKVHYDR